MAGLPEVIAELANEPQLWWGHVEGHGWVVLDRDDARNEEEFVRRVREAVLQEISGLHRRLQEHGSWETSNKFLFRDSRHLIRCRDWAQIEVSREEFGSARFKWFKTYVSSLPEAQAQEACGQLLDSRRELMTRIGSFRITKEEFVQCVREAELHYLIELHRRLTEYKKKYEQGMEDWDERVVKQYERYWAEIIDGDADREMVDEDSDREMLMDLGLDPDDPDYSELAPHGMDGDEVDDEFGDEIDEDNYEEGEYIDW